MFADTGIPLLFDAAYDVRRGEAPPAVRVAGGAQMMDREGVFNIGKRNYLAMRKILWKAGVMVQGEEVGGKSSRTVRLEIAADVLAARQSSAKRGNWLPPVAKKGAIAWPSAS